jgi:C4-dicarboxylate transporter DctQ subunit
MDKVLDIFEKGLVVILVISASVLYFSQVITRYLFGFTFPWAEEMMVTLLVWSIFVGSSIAARKGLHVSVDVLVNFFPPLLKRITHYAGLCICLIFSSAMVVFGTRYVMFIKSAGTTVISSGLPQYLNFICVPLGGLLMSIRFLQYIVRSAAEDIHGRGVEEGT